MSCAIFDWWDKVQHALAIVVLMLLGFFAYPKYFWRMAIGLILYDVFIEIIQSWTGWRHGNVSDAFAGMVGVLMIAFLIRGYQKYCIRHRY